ncbi:MAG: hypothetical protein J6Q87_03330, partial [Clostridia bacterium]|nr:hypothetical protein [Clostridia bacterium]
AKRVNSIFASIPFMRVREFALYGKATQDGEPTPENPQPIEVSGASGSVVVKSVGKNRINPNDCIQAFLNAENGTTQSSSWWITTEYINVLPNEQFTFSSNAENVQLIRFVEYNSEKKYIKGSNLATTEDITLNVGNTTKYIRLSFGINASIAKEDFFASYSVQLERGNISTEIENYKETTATIPTENGLAGIKVSSNGNYTDQNGQQWICGEVAKYADGSGEKVQRFAKAKIKDLSWAYDGSKMYSAALDGIKAKGLLNLLCTNMIVSVDGNYIRIRGDNSYGYLYVYNSPHTNAVDFVNAYGEGEILYQLATPIITDLTAEEITEIEKLSAVYPANNISISDDCGMKLNFDQYYETKKIVSAWANKDGVPAKVFDSASEITAFKGIVIEDGNNLSYKLPIEIPLNSKLIENPTGNGGILTSVVFGYTASLLTLTDAAVKKYKYIEVVLVTNSVTTVCNYRNNSTLEMVSRTVKPNVHVQGELVDGKVKISGKTITIIAEPPTFEGFTYVNTLQPQISGVAVSKVVLYS